MFTTRCDVTWNERNNYLPTSFSGFLQMFTENTVTSMNSTRLLSHPVKVLFLNESQYYIQLPIKMVWKKSDSFLSRLWIVGTAYEWLNNC